MKTISDEAETFIIQKVKDQINLNVLIDSFFEDEEGKLNRLNPSKNNILNSLKNLEIRVVSSDSRHKKDLLNFKQNYLDTDLFRIKHITFESDIDKVFLRMEKNHRMWIVEPTQMFLDRYLDVFIAEYIL